MTGCGEFALQGAKLDGETVRGTVSKHPSFLWPLPYPVGLSGDTNQASFFLVWEQGLEPVTDLFVFLDKAPPFGDNNYTNEKQGDLNTMKKLTLFYLTHCPYCKNADKAIASLIEENPKYKEIVIDRIEESKNPEIANGYDYYYVPTIFCEKSKLYEAHPGESYGECKEKIKSIFDGLV